MILRSEPLLESHGQQSVVNRETQSNSGGPGFHDRKSYRSSDLTQDLDDRHPGGVDRDERRVIHDAHLRLGARHSGGEGPLQRGNEKDGRGPTPPPGLHPNPAPPPVPPPPPLSSTKKPVAPPAERVVSRVTIA